MSANISCGIPESLSMEARYERPLPTSLSNSLGRVFETRPFQEPQRCPPQKTVGVSSIRKLTIAVPRQIIAAHGNRSFSADFVPLSSALLVSRFAAPLSVAYRYRFHHRLAPLF